MAPDGSDQLRAHGRRVGRRDDRAQAVPRDHHLPQRGATRAAVVNLTDDAMLFAQGAISEPAVPLDPGDRRARRGAGGRLLLARARGGVDRRHATALAHRDPGGAPRDAGASSSASTARATPCSRRRSSPPGPTCSRAEEIRAEFARLQVDRGQDRGAARAGGDGAAHRVCPIAVASSSRRRPGSTSACSTSAARWGGASAAWAPRCPPSLLLEAGPRRAADAPTGPDAERAAEFARRFLAHHGCPAASVSPCTGRSRRTAGSAPAPSSAWRWRGRWPSCYGLPTEPAALARAVGRGRALGDRHLDIRRGRLHRGRRAAAGSGRHRAAAGPLADPGRRGAAWWRCLAGPRAERRGRGRGVRRLPPPAGAGGRAGRPLVLMQLLPALVEADLPSFGDALSEIQRITGAWFAPAARRDLRAGPHGDAGRRAWRSGARRAWARAPGDRRFTGWSGARRTAAELARAGAELPGTGAAGFSRGDSPRPGPGSGGRETPAARD